MEQSGAHFTDDIQFVPLHTVWVEVDFDCSIRLRREFFLHRRETVHPRGALRRERGEFNRLRSGVLRYPQDEQERKYQ